MTELLRHHGYLAVFFTVALNGELGLLLGIGLVRSGSVTMPGVVIVGTVAALLGNALYYAAGAFLWDRWGFLKRRFGAKVESTAGTVHKAGLPLMLVARFLFGVRNIVPLALGIYRANVLAFMPFNVAGSLLWALAFTGAGQLLSPAIVRILGRVA